MFDIDGTLVQSYDFDTQCFAQAVETVLGTRIDTDWGNYTDVTDSGILSSILDELSMTESDRTIVAQDVKDTFIHLVEKHIETHPVAEIPGAARFINLLAARPDTALAFATGGWRETALLKLAAAGIDPGDIPIASASDHHRRVDIMKTAATIAGGEPYDSITYIGDGPWDKSASAYLGYRFILVGNRVAHTPSIPNFSETDAVLELLRL
ncbi:HAD family hydrolase [Saccharospirillum salsuginis]|nr:HAD family hydrolase [Saccharospirillum salsuginis]